MSMSPDTRHWRGNRRWTVIFLLVWFLATWVSIYFARDLDALFLGAPLGFWLAAQGLPLLYLAVVAGYAVCMTRLDRRP